MVTSQYTCGIHSSESMYLYSEKEHKSNIYKKMIEEGVEYYKRIDRYLYLISETQEYYKIDFETYEIVLKENDLNSLTDADKLIFENLSAFITKDEALKLSE